MKIVNARIYYIQPGGRGLNPVLVELRTDEGVSGVGEAAIAYGLGGTAAAGMIKELAEGLLMGKDPFRIEAIWSEMYDQSFWAKGGGPIVFAGISAIEQALWDIKGKTLGIPVYEMLGGKIRDEVRVYANGWSFQCQTPDDYARAGERAVKDGYNALKCYPLAVQKESHKSGLWHVTRRAVDRDVADLAVAKVKALRDAVGSDVDILVDLSGGLAADAILPLCRRFEELDLLFIEEPVDPFDVESLKKVSEQVRIPIAVGERLYTRYGFRPILERHACDVIQPDIGNTGGIMETKKIAALAEAYNVRVQPHTCASPVSTAAALQIDACITNFLIQELYPYRSEAHFQIVDHAPERDVRNSMLPIPARPGLGINLVEEQVRPHLWAECTL